MTLPHGHLRLRSLLCGIALVCGLFGGCAPAHPALAERTVAETIQQEAPSPDPSADAPAQESASSSVETESVGENVLEWVFGVLILGPIVLLLMSLLLAFPTVFLAVSLVMDGSCLRFILFGVGWLCALILGGLVAALVGEGIFEIEFLSKSIFYLFTWGYPVAAFWGHRKFQSMSPERYQAWKQSLTGGALLGLGAGSIAGLARSAASGFGGFGGGSFGGGGASGSWSGTSGTAGSAASTAAGGTSSTAAGTATTAAGSTSEAAALTTGAAPGVAGTESAGAPDEGAGSRGWWTRLRQWFQKFQWYHGFAFVLVTLVFVPLGLGTMQALQNTKFFVFALVCVVVYSGYKLLRRYPDAPEAVLTTISSFHGGEASSSWS